MYFFWWRRNRAVLIEKRREEERIKQSESASELKARLEAEALRRNRDEKIRKYDLVKEQFDEIGGACCC
jgi:hypothetical protein